jgi:hypothetical protein
MLYHYALSRFGNYYAECRYAKCRYSECHGDVILVDVHDHKNGEGFKPSFKTFRKIILRHFSTFIPDGSNSGKASNKRINTNDN